jgi:DNA replication and repair protein RecF
MRVRRLVVRGYRNLADLDCEVPSRGAAILGANAQGKTNLLEAIYYPVLFRSFRDAPDQQVVGDRGGFHLELELDGAGPQHISTTYIGRKKRITLDGEVIDRVTEAVGAWLAVAFLPSDLALASGPAAERRLYLDRLLSLAGRSYLKALGRFRAVLAQRNSALRQGHTDVARAFDVPLAEVGGELVRTRIAWVAGAAEQFAAEFDCLGEREPARLLYQGSAELGEPSSWSWALDVSLPEDLARGMTTIGPHRHDMLLEIGGRRIREYGSTGQQRSAAVALKLIEISTLRQSRGTEPALLLDDVFAELDRERQTRLALRLTGPAERQVFITSPRADELPPNLELPEWVIDGGKVESRESRVSSS